MTRDDRLPKPVPVIVIHVSVPPDPAAGETPVMTGTVPAAARGAGSAAGGRGGPARSELAEVLPVRVGRDPAALGLPVAADPAPVDRDDPLRTAVDAVALRAVLDEDEGLGAVDEHGFVLDPLGDAVDGPAGDGEHERLRPRCPWPAPSPGGSAVVTMWVWPAFHWLEGAVISPRTTSSAPFASAAVSMGSIRACAPAASRQSASSARAAGARARERAGMGETWCILSSSPLGSGAMGGDGPGTGGDVAPGFGDAEGGSLSSWTSRDPWPSSIRLVKAPPDGDTGPGLRLRAGGRAVRAVAAELRRMTVRPLLFGPPAPS